jgi:predicted Zn-dependent protease
MKSEKFKELLAANPENELFRFSLGQALMDEGNPSKAIPLFEQCQQKKPDWMMASILKAKCQIALKRMEEARVELNRALKLAIEQEHEAPEAEIRKLLAAVSPN